MKDGKNRTSNDTTSHEALDADQPPLVPDNSANVFNSRAVAFDPLEFVHFLADTGWSDDQKTEYARLVWGIVWNFIEMGYDVHPLQLAENSGGKPAETDGDAPGKMPKMVDSPHSKLIAEFMRTDASHVHPSEKESQP